MSSANTDDNIKVVRETVVKRKAPWSFIILISIVSLITWLWNSGHITSDPEVTTGGKSRIKITAEDIERILEVNGASQKVTVETDSAFTSLDPKVLFGYRFNFLEKEERHRLHEIRTWLIKAGCTGFALKQGDTATLVLHRPVITSREHLSEQYTVVKRVGVWNPVTLKQLEIQSREKAVANAIGNGILIEAEFSIENGLREFLPKPLNIEWEQKTENNGTAVIQ